MFRPFKLDFRFNPDTSLASAGRQLHQESQRAVKTTLSDYLKEGGALEASEIMDDWFPEINADVFISHSHRDEQQAFILAGFLAEHFGLRSFVDSAVWGNYPDLLKMVDDVYSPINLSEGLYSYEKCRDASAHVHMMLSASLLKMIDKCEAVFFMDTPNSISSKEAVEKKTKSPWIYLELQIVDTIEIKPLESHRGIIKESAAKEEDFSARMLQVEYPASFNRFTELSFEKFKYWERSWSVNHKHSHALDLLYAMYPVDWKVELKEKYGR